ncbi:preprotein translocase subunit YajC [Chryseobacterium salipaludis]|uniref:preprotein translocase subunit YajC n=1 Tax=Chryseobacterium TaxID=59732 RepID=UPI000E8C938D|nr:MULTISPECIES: preprotein translocase subunit YajC [Chryseobacterium]MCJ8497642.1 preprotein translocase subunit YajC [Chryseobacterium salipaludis]MCX3296051.1 preprotein translocase subunit YajC [Planobacterium sp. JC490]HAV02621.1 preprotein translocase subunit YajC [Chryseobacterium sp.]
MLTIFLQAGPPEASMTPTLVMIGLMFVGFYFLMIRPQSKKAKLERNFQESLKVGSRVVTTSGMHGRVAQILEDSVIIETLSGKLKFEKAAISQDFTKQRYPEAEAEKK